MLIEFEENMSYDEQLKSLIEYHKIPKHFKVDTDDIPMVVMALNQDDISSIDVNDEGGIEIGYYGNEWQNKNE